jgi:hypothetical protein
LRDAQQAEVGLHQDHRFDLRRRGQGACEEVLQGVPVVQVVGFVFDVASEKFELIDGRQQVRFQRHLYGAESLLQAVVHEFDGAAAAGQQLGHQDGGHGDQHEPADGDAEKQGDGVLGQTPSLFHRSSQLRFARPDVAPSRTSPPSNNPRTWRSRSPLRQGS